MDEYGYGLWAVVAIDSAIFIIFAFSVFHPASKRDWRAMGAFSGFVVALFAEMYGYPLTIYLLTSWLGNRFPQLTLSHNGGHIWADLIGWKGDPHLSPFHIGSYILIAGGFVLISTAWRRLWESARSGRLATEGPYRWVRHPQYDGVIMIMIGFLLQWPTLPTVALFPVLVLIYRRLAISEEREMYDHFGQEWASYSAVVPAFMPRLRDHMSRRRPLGSAPNALN